jgi:hypothetical protein
MGNKRKISFTIIIAAVVIVIVALLFIFRDSLFGNIDRIDRIDHIDRFDTTTFNSDIVIKRSDAQEPLNMPYRYSKVLMDNRLVYNEEIVGINISSVKYGVSDTGLSLYNYKDVLKNGDSKEAKAVVDSIKYCKGVTTLSGIISDKEKSKITIYEGYTADLMIESLHHYVIIPSALSDYINEELPENEKVLFIMNPETNGLAYFTIIGEYETKNESDALYLSYCGLSTLVLGGRKDIKEVEEIKPIALSRNITVKSLRHLATHTNFIDRVDEKGNVIPNKLLNVYKDEEILTYENKFLNTLIYKLALFIDVRYEKLKEYGADEVSNVMSMDIETKVVDTEEVRLISRNGKRFRITYGIQYHIQRIAPYISQSSYSAGIFLYEGGTERSGYSSSSAAACLNVVDIAQFSVLHYLFNHLHVLVKSRLKTY